ncbi:MAG: hypothetical protein K5772_08295 [Clostridia bacterium]|nr:hypothetical protein [Clostridia bacterium]
MAVIKKDQEFQSRHLHRDQAGVRALSDAEIAQLNQQFNLSEDLGIPMDREGNPTFTQGHADVPRVFFTLPGADMADTIKTAAEAGISIGSKEFWRQVQLGNVFVYPSGQRCASQLQVSDPAKGEPSVSLSKAITYSTDLPVREIPKPGFFKRMFSFLVPKWREQIRSYDNQGYSNVDLVMKDHLNKRSQETADAEKRDYDRKKEFEKKEAQRQANSGNYKKIRDRYSEIDVKSDNVDRIFGLNPAPKQSWMINKIHDDGTEEIINQNAHVREENFKQLKAYDLDMSQIRSDTLKTSFTEDDFITTAFFATNTEDILKNTFPMRHGTRIDNIGRLKAAGLKEADAEWLTYEYGSNALNTDYYDTSNPRPSTGNISIPFAVKPAREETKKAFEAYAGGDKTKLAKLIAVGVKKAAVEHCRMEESSKTSIGVRSAGGMLEQTAKLGDLIAKDPQLAEIAKKQYGMKEEDLQLVNGVREFKKLSDARRKAQERLTSAEMEGEEIDAEQKKKYVKDIVKADLAERIIIDQKNNLKLSAEAEQTKKYIEERMQVDHRIQDPDHPGKLIDAPLKDGFFAQSDAVNFTIYGIPALLGERPKFVRSLKADSPQLDLVAENIVKTDKLYDPNMSAKETFEKADQHLYSAQALKQAADPLKKPAEEIQNVKSGPDAQKNVDQLKAVFEPKKTEGPNVPTA